MITDILGFIFIGILLLTVITISVISLIDSIKDKSKGFILINIVVLIELLLMAAIVVSISI